MGQGQRAICAPVVADPALGARIDKLIPAPICPSEASTFVGAVFTTWFSFDREQCDLRLTLNPSPNPVRLLPRPLGKFLGWKLH